MRAARRIGGSRQPLGGHIGFYVGFASVELLLGALGAFGWGGLGCVVVGIVISAIAYQWSLYRLNRGICVQDIRVIFGAAFFLYSAVLPISVWMGFGFVNGYTADDQNIAFSAMYCLCAQIVLHGVVVLRGAPWRDDGIVEQASRPIAAGRAMLSIGILALLVGYNIYYTYSAGATRFVGNRSEADVSYINQGWVVLNQVMLGAIIFHLAQQRMFGGTQRRILWCVMLVYVVYTLLLGNRREVAAIALVVIVVHEIYSAARLSWWCRLASLGLFLLGLWIGVVRDTATQTTLVDDAVGIKERAGRVLASNEFSVPIQTLSIYMERGVHQHFYGLTYVMLPAYLVPRMFWPDKPISLGNRFVKEMSTQERFQGFAYTPMTEAYLNFGVFGCIVAAAGIGALLEFLVASARKMFSVYIVAISLVLDFNRGEFALVLFQWGFVWAMYRILRTICGIDDGLMIGVAKRRMF